MLILVPLKRKGDKNLRNLLSFHFPVCGSTHGNKYRIVESQTSNINAECAIANIQYVSIWGYGHFEDLRWRHYQLYGNDENIKLEAGFIVGTSIAAIFFKYFGYVEALFGNMMIHLS